MQPKVKFSAVCQSILLMLCLSCFSCNEPSQTQSSEINQRFSLLPGNIVMAKKDCQSNSRSCYAYIVPKENMTLSIKWVSIKRIFPQGWDIFFCDNTGYHIGMPDSCTLNPISDISAENEITLGLMVNMNGIQGCGHFEMTVEEVGMPGKDTLKFIVE